MEKLCVSVVKSLSHKADYKLFFFPPKNSVITVVSICAKVFPVLLSNSSSLYFREKKYNIMSDKSTVLPNKILKTTKKYLQNHQQTKKTERFSLPSGLAATCS